MNCTINKYLFVLIMDHNCSPFFLIKQYTPFSGNLRPAGLGFFCIILFLKNHSIVVYLCVLRTLFLPSQYMDMSDLYEGSLDFSFNYLCLQFHFHIKTKNYFGDIHIDI